MNIMAYHGQGVNIDVVYPDPEPLSKPGPHLSALQQAYYEEHGVLPVPELTRDLLDTFWKSIHRDNAEECVKGVEGGVNTQPPEANLREPRQLNVHQNVSNQAQRVPNRDGPIYFAQNRLELVPFLGASPAEVYSGHLPVSMVSSSPCPQYVGSDFDLAAISRESCPVGWLKSSCVKRDLNLNHQTSSADMQPPSYPPRCQRSAHWPVRCWCPSW